MSIPTASGGEGLTSITPPTDRPLLFEWLRLLAIAQARGAMTGKRAAVATLIALDSRGTSGEDARVDDAGIVLELGIHRATVWRHVAALSEDGWMERVSAAVGATRGKAGRRAVYRLTVPTIDLMGKGLPTVGDNSESCRTDTPEDATRPVDNPTEVVSHSAEGNATRPPVDNESRVAKQGQSCRTTTPDDATLPPSTDLRLPTYRSRPDPRQEAEPCGQTTRSELVAEARAALRRPA